MSLAQFWRGQGQRYRLSGYACARCGSAGVTPRAVCPECRPQIQEAEPQEERVFVWTLPLFDQVNELVPAIVQLN